MFSGAETRDRRRDPPAAGEKSNAPWRTQDSCSRCHRTAGTYVPVSQAPWGLSADCGRTPGAIGAASRPATPRPLRGAPRPNPGPEPDIRPNDCRRRSRPRPGPAAAADTPYHEVLEEGAPFHRTKLIFHQQPGAQAEIIFSTTSGFRKPNEELPIRHPPRQPSRVSSASGSSRRWWRARSKAIRLHRKSLDLGTTRGEMIDPRDPGSARRKERPSGWWQRIGRANHRYRRPRRRHFWCREPLRDRRMRWQR